MKKVLVVVPPSHVLYSKAKGKVAVPELAECILVNDSGKSNINYFRDGWMIAKTVFKHAFK